MTTEVIKYRTFAHTDEILALVVLKETKHQITFLDSKGIERREHKVSIWQNWFDSWEKAQFSLLLSYSKQSARLAKQAKQADDAHTRILNMKNPNLA